MEVSGGTCGPWSRVRRAAWSRRLRKATRRPGGRLWTVSAASSGPLPAAFASAQPTRATSIRRSGFVSPRTWAASRTRTSLVRGSPRPHGTRRLRLIRGRGRAVLMEDATLVDLLPADEATPELAALEAEQASLEADRVKRMWRAFRNLPARCQQLLRVLMATHRPSYAEAAAALDVPVGSIGPTRARCLQAVAAALLARYPRASRRLIPRRRTTRGTDVRDEPDDAVLEEQLRQIIERLDPVPERLLAAAKDCYTWRTVDSDLAELVFDSMAEDHGVLVRGADDPRLLSFEAHDLTSTSRSAAADRPAASSAS